MGTVGLGLKGRGGGALVREWGENKPLTQHRGSPIRWSGGPERGEDGVLLNDEEDMRAHDGLRSVELMGLDAEQP